MYLRTSWIRSGLSAPAGKKEQTETGRKLLSEMIRNRYGCEEYRLTYNENGKPLTDICFFNISHAGDMVVCALSDRPVGVDTEKIDLVKKRERYLLFSDRETRYVNAGENYEERFYLLWTRKEAYVKARGGKLTDASVELVGEDGKPLARKNGFVFRTHRVQGYLISICEKENGKS